MTVSTNCFIVTFRRSSARVTQPAAARRSTNSIPKTVCCMCRPAVLDKFAGDLRAAHPDFAYSPHGEPQALHNAGPLAWGSGPRGEAPDYTGLDVIIVRNGKIAAALRVPQFDAFIAATALSLISEPIPTRKPCASSQSSSLKIAWPLAGVTRQVRVVRAAPRLVPLVKVRWRRAERRLGTRWSTSHWIFFFCAQNCCGSQRSFRKAATVLGTSQSSVTPVFAAIVVGSGRNRTSCPQGPRLQRGDGTSLSLWHVSFGCGPRGCTGPSRRMRPRGFLADLPAQGEVFNSLACCRYSRGQQNDGGCLTCRSPHLAVPSRFDRAP